MPINPLLFSAVDCEGNDVQLAWMVLSRISSGWAPMSADISKVKLMVAPGAMAKSGFAAFHEKTGRLPPNVVVSTLSGGSVPPTFDRNVRLSTAARSSNTRRL